MDYSRRTASLVLWFKPQAVSAHAVLADQHKMDPRLPNQRPIPPRLQQPSEPRSVRDRDNQPVAVDVDLFDRHDLAQCLTEDWILRITRPALVATAVALY